MSKSSPSKQIAVIVIPTYNEAKNIGKMIDYLNEKTFHYIQKKNEGLTFDWDMHVLVVDGNSPDGTAKIVEEKSKKYKTTHLFLETSKDLSDFIRFPKVSDCVLDGVAVFQVNQ